MIIKDYHRVARHVDSDTIEDGKPTYESYKIQMGKEKGLSSAWLEFFENENELETIKLVIQDLKNRRRVFEGDLLSIFKQKELKSLSKSFPSGSKVGAVHEPTKIKSHSVIYLKPEKLIRDRKNIKKFGLILEKKCSNNLKIKKKHFAPLNSS